MRALVFALLLTATAVHAQAPRNDTADRLAMGGVALGASALAFGIGATQDRAEVIVIAPLASAVTGSLTGYLRGRSGSLNGALGGAVLAAVPGAVVAVVTEAAGGGDVGTAIASVLYVALPPVGAVYGFENARPKLFPLPSGEVVPGLAITVGL
ncbi:MAG: hypothetical protein AAF791_13785 [Bacteroidota bacterium]